MMTWKKKPTCDCCGCTKIYADDQCADCYLVSRRADYAIDMTKAVLKELNKVVDEPTFDRIQDELTEWLCNYGSEEHDIRSGKNYKLKPFSVIDND